MLICRNYRGDIDMSCIDKFMTLVMDREEEGQTTPIIQHGNVTFVYIKYNNLYLVATTMKNCNIALVFSFLHKLVEVGESMQNYFKFCIYNIIVNHSVAVMMTSQIKNSNYLYKNNL